MVIRILPAEHTDQDLRDLEAKTGMQVISVRKCIFGDGTISEKHVEVELSHYMSVGAQKRAKKKVTDLTKWMGA